MERKELVEKLIEEFKKVPNRDVCRVATKDEVKVIADEMKIDFETMIQFSSSKALLLTICAIPKEFHFEAIMFFTMAGDYYFDEFYFQNPEETIWNLNDQETLDEGEKIKVVFYNLDKVWLNSILDIRVEDMLKYAQSDLPDF